MLTERQLRMAAWMAVASAVLQIPILIASIASSAFVGEGVGQLVSNLLGIGSLVLLVYILMTFKKLLGSWYDFHDADALISGIIIANIALTGLQMMISLSPAARADTAGIAVVLSIIAMVPLGVAYVMLGVRVLNLDGTLYGLLAPFAYLSIATGVCFALVVLFPVGILTNAATDVVTAMVFVRAADDLVQRARQSKAGTSLPA